MLKEEHPNSNYIKLFRQAKKNPLFKKPFTFHYFTFCLLSAWWSDEPTTFSLGGVEVLIHKGEFATTLKRSAAETGLSVQNVRTAIKNLIRAGMLTNDLTSELTNQLTNGGRVLKVCNYTRFQANIFGANKRSNKQPNKQPNKLIKKVKKEGIKNNPPIIPPRRGENVKDVADFSKTKMHRSKIKNIALYRQLVKSFLDLDRHDTSQDERINEKYNQNRTANEAKEEIKREGRD